MNRTISRRINKKNEKLKKRIRGAIRTLKVFAITFGVVIVIQALPVILGLSPYYQWQYERANLFEKPSVLIRGWKVKHGKSYVAFNTYNAEMNGNEIADESYTDKADKNEAHRLMKEWGIYDG